MSHINTHNSAVAQLVEKLISPYIQKMQAYHVADSKNMIKLDAMENPNGIPEDLKSAWLDILQSAEINRYPETVAKKIQYQLIDELMSNYVDENVEQCDVIFGNGSDELIQLLIQAIDKNAGPVMSPAPSFVMYQISAKVNAKDFIAIALKDDFTLDINHFIAQIKLNRPSLIFISYPNNPTGNLFNKDDVVSIIEYCQQEDHKALVVIDEAYGAFSRDSFSSDFLKHSNVVLVKTLSKVGFAGIRFGMLFGHKLVLEQINKIRPPYNINVLTQKTVEFYLNNKPRFEQQALELISARTRLFDKLNTLANIHVYPSEANFITFKCLNHVADEVFMQLKQQGILIKNLHQAKSLLENCLRVTIGTDEQNEQFFKALQQILNP